MQRINRSYKDNFINTGNFRIEQSCIWIAIIRKTLGQKIKQEKLIQLIGIFEFDQVVMRNVFVYIFNYIKS